MRAALTRWSCGVVCAVLCAGSAGAGTIAPGLAAALAHTEARTLVPATVILRGGPTADEVRFAAQGLTGAARRAAVRALLETFARDTQAPLLRRVRAAAAQGVASERVRSSWLVDAVALEAAPALLRELAARPEVDRVLGAAPARLFDASPACTDVPLEAAADRSPDATLECGVSRMNAPQVWSTYGNRGEGVIIALIDTGSCTNHPDIKGHVWVNPGEDVNHNGVVMDAADVNGVDDDGNGYVDDLIGWDFGSDDNDPSDADGHGSHTAGTLVGDGTGGRQTGMAPGAKLMVLRIAMGNWSDEVDSWSALQYAAANGADVVSMSYGWYHGDLPDRAGWRDAFDRLHAMGVVTVNASGNAGGSNPPDDVGTPPDVPATITVGATDCDDVIASFSSQGPSAWDTVAPYWDFPYPPGVLKPEVTGPGVSTWSLNKCSGYATMSGTSMAAPHVAGAAALVLAKKRDTSQAEMKHLLESTAVELGDPGPDRAYGSGRVDAFAAVGAANGWVGFASYRVVDAAPQGNGNGAADPGELVTLAVTLHDSAQAGIAHAVSAVLRSTTPGVVVHDDVAFYGDIPAGGSVESLAPHFTFTASAACGAFAAFDLTTRSSDGATGTTSFLVKLGTMQTTTIFADDMESDRGWTRGGTSTGAHFVRDDPHAVNDKKGELSQPEDDHTPAGTRCWITGNRWPITYAEDDDVDGGSEEIVSPRFDTTGYADGRFEFWFWSILTGQGLSNFDLLETDLSNDDGATWTQLEAYSTPGMRHWSKSEYSLNVLPASNRMRFKLVVTDNGIDSEVDALLDDFKVTGRKPVCAPYTPPAARAPNGVGATLAAARAGADVRLDWSAPPADGGHDAATLFRVLRSDAAAGPFTETGSATVTWHYEVGEGAAAGSIRFWQVRAENAGGSEGP